MHCLCRHFFNDHVKYSFFIHHSFIIYSFFIHFHVIESLIIIHIQVNWFFARQSLYKFTFVSCFLHFFMHISEWSNEQEIESLKQWAHCFKNSIFFNLNDKITTNNISLYKNTSRFIAWCFFYIQTRFARNESFTTNTQSIHSSDKQSFRREFSNRICWMNVLLTKSCFQIDKSLYRRCCWLVVLNKLSISCFSSCSMRKSMCCKNNASK